MYSKVLGAAPFQVVKISFDAKNTAPFLTPEKTAHFKKEEFPISVPQDAERVQITARNQSKLEAIYTEGDVGKKYEWILKNQSLRWPHRALHEIKKWIPGLWRQEKEYYLIYHSKENGHEPAESKKWESYISQFNGPQAKMHYLYGDTIVLVRHFYKRNFSGKKQHVAFIASLVTNETKASKEFFKSGYIPLDKLLRNDPDVIFVDVGKDGKKIKNSLEAWRDIVHVSHEINFKFDQKELTSYQSKIIEDVKALEDHPEINYLFNLKNVESDILYSRKIWLIEKNNPDRKQIKALLKEALKNNILKNYVQGEKIFSLTSGMTEGFLIQQIHELLHTGGLLSHWGTFMITVFPILVIQFHLKLIGIFSRIRHAEKLSHINPHVINYELRRVAFWSASGLSLCSAFLVALHPALLSSFLLPLTGGIWIITGLFFVAEFLKNIIYYADYDNAFRIYKNTLGANEKFNRVMLNIKTYVENLCYSRRVAGFGIGFGLMLASEALALPLLGVIPIILGAIWGCAAKFIYPYYSINYQVSLKFNDEPTVIGNQTIALIPGRVILKDKKEMAFEEYSFGQWMTVDPKEVEIILSDPQRDKPVIIYKKGFYFSRNVKKIILKWPSENKKLVINLHQKTTQAKLEVDPKDPHRYKLVF